MLEKKNQHVLVTGPSGAGKSTLAKQLAEERGMPLVRIDLSPSWNAMFARDPEDKHMVPGTAEHAYYQTLRRRLAAAAMRRRTPSIIEGTQLLTLSPERAAQHELHLVAPPRDVVLDRRWNRLSTKSKNLDHADDPAWREAKYRVANTLYDEAEPDIARWRGFPGVHVKESAAHPALVDLKRAKAESDRKNYSAKNQILSELLGKHPDEFVQDSIQGRTIGLTHQPTGFKLHAPAMVVQGRAAPQPLYHGSATPDIKQFEPRTSRVLGGEKAVFGTPDRDLAISFGQPWHDEDFEQGYVNRKPYMREQYPGAFQKIYGGKPGTLYTLPGHGFAPDPRLMREERINRGAVTPEAAEHIPDMLAALRATRFKMYPYRKRTKTAAIPLCMIKVALTPAEIAEAQRVRDATQAKQDYNDRYWGQTLLSPAVALGNAMTRAGYAGRGALYGAGGAGLGAAALFPQGLGRAGQALGVPGANNLTAASDAFASKNWNASGAGFKDVGSYLSDAEMPTGNVNAVGTENREMFDQAGENVLGTAYRGADWTGHLATQAIPGLGLGKGLGMVGQGIAKVAPRATQAISTATRAAGPAGNYAADTVGKLGQGASAPLTGPVSGAWQAARTMTPMTTIGKEVVTRGYNALPTTAAPANAQTPPVGMAAQHKATTTPAPAMATKPTPAPAIASPPPKKLPTTPGVPGIKTAADKQLVRVKVDAGDGKFLLHHYIRANTWDHPAGKAEPGESLPEAAARELHERAGYHVDPAHLTHTGQEGAFTTFTVPLAKTRRISAPGEAGGYKTRVKVAAPAGPVEKLADLMPWVNLQPQQKRVAKRVREGQNLLVYHGLGSGKSLAGIAAAEGVGGPYAAIVPASLRPNYEGEINKFSDKTTPSEVLSYTGVGMGKQLARTPDTVIMDEVQRLRNPDSAGSRAAMDLAMQARHKVLLSGTPIVNAPSDLAVPLSILSGKEMSPASFNKQFVGSKTVDPGWMGWFKGVQPAKVPTLQNEDDLEKMLEGHVDYQPSRTPEGVKTKDERVEVDLSPEQQDFYKLMWGKLPWMMRWKLSNDYPLSKQEIAHLSSFMTGPRQAALSLYPFHSSKDPMRAYQTSSKLQSAMSSLKETLAKDPRAKALIYSNFIDAGLTPYAAALKAEGIPYGQFHGTMSEEDRKQALADYNEGRSRVLMLGPAAAEGISAKGTQLIQLLDPHWNEARLGQARGRGLRFDSHEGLPPELRNVRIQRFVSKMPPPGWLGKLFGAETRPSADEILEHQSQRKEELNEQFREVLRRVGSPGYQRPWSLFG